MHYAIKNPIQIRSIVVMEKRQPFTMHRDLPTSEFVVSVPIKALSQKCASAECRVQELLSVLVGALQHLCLCFKSVVLTSLLQFLLVEFIALGKVGGLQVKSEQFHYQWYHKSGLIRKKKLWPQHSNILSHQQNWSELQTDCLAIH